MCHVRLFHDNHTCENYRFSVKIIAFQRPSFRLYIINRKIHGCLEIPDLVLVLNTVISHSFAALIREISCSTLEINLVFPRTHVLFSTGCIKKKVIELQRAIVSELLCVWTRFFHIRKDHAFSCWMIPSSCQMDKKW
jgi:hypothetical protein